VQLLCTRNSDHSDSVVPPRVPVRFRCYARLLMSSHVVLTVVPATYDDIVALMSLLDSLGSSVVAEAAASSTVDDNVEPSSEVVNGHVHVDFSNDEKICDNLNSRQPNADVDASLQNVEETVSDKSLSASDSHGARLPVFVFDCLLNLVSDQLVHHSSGDRPPDIVEDFTYQVSQVALYYELACDYFSVTYL